MLQKDQLQHRNVPHSPGNLNKGKNKVNLIKSTKYLSEVLLIFFKIFLFEFAPKAAIRKHISKTVRPYQVFQWRNRYSTFLTLIKSFNGETDKVHF